MSDRKDDNRMKNEAQRHANLEYVSRANIPAQESVHTKTRTGKDGKTYEVQVTKNVRPSKLVRLHRRSLERKNPELAALLAVE